MTCMCVGSGVSVFVGGRVFCARDLLSFQVATTVVSDCVDADLQTLSWLGQCWCVHASLRVSACACLNFPGYILICIMGGLVFVFIHALFRRVCGHTFASRKLTIPGK